MAERIVGGLVFRTGIPRPVNKRGGKRKSKWGSILEMRSGECLIIPTPTKKNESAARSVSHLYNKKARQLGLEDYRLRSYAMEFDGVRAIGIFRI